MCIGRFDYVSIFAAMKSREKCVKLFPVCQIVGPSFSALVLLCFHVSSSFGSGSDCGSGWARPVLERENYFIYMHYWKLPQQPFTGSTNTLSMWHKVYRKYIPISIWVIYGLCYALGCGAHKKAFHAHIVHMQSAFPQSPPPLSLNPWNIVLA